MNLCIKDSYRGHGYGRLLLNGLQKEAITINCKLLFLECRPSNNAALKLYYSEGYNEVGIRKNYYPAPNGYEDAIMLAKNV
jgi:ribosomal-protein-alanine N-acetyltransferase